MLTQPTIQYTYWYISSSLLKCQIDGCRVCVDKCALTIELKGTVSWFLAERNNRVSASFGLDE